MMTEFTAHGAAMITTERLRQIHDEGWVAEYDDKHTQGELALAACCYAAPRPLYAKDELVGGGVRFKGLWPTSWNLKWDKRQWVDGEPQDARRTDTKTRISHLIKAGALIAAEIDRLLRLPETES